MVNIKKKFCRTKATVNGVIATIKQLEDEGIGNLISKKPKGKVRTCHNWLKPVQNNDINYLLYLLFRHGCLKKNKILQDQEGKAKLMEQLKKHFSVGI